MDPTTIEKEVGKVVRIINEKIKQKKINANLKKDLTTIKAKMKTLGSQERTMRTIETTLNFVHNANRSYDGLAQEQALRLERFKNHRDAVRNHPFTEAVVAIVKKGKSRMKGVEFWDKLSVPRAAEEGDVETDD